MKKLILVLALCLVLITGAACMPSSNPKPTDPTEVNLDLDRNMTAELSILVPGGNANETDMILKANEGFNLLYPNVNISVNYLSVNTYENDIRQLVAAETLDDIIWTNSPDFYYLVANNVALNLNAYIEASEEANVFDFEEDFLTEYFDMGSHNGKLYAVPRSADSVVTFFNRTILTAAGVNLELVENGWSWDTFMTICQQVRDYFDANNMSDRYVLDANLTTWLSTSYPILRSFGADVVDDEGNVTIDSPQTREALELVREMVEKRFIVESVMSSGSSFESGTSAFLFQSASVSLYANRKDLKGNIDIVSFPLIQETNNPKIGSGIAGYSINAASDKRDLAWAYINYLMSYDGQQQLALGGLNLPSVRNDLQDYSNPEINWSKDYSDFNLEAYLYGAEYKTGEDFLGKFDPSYKTMLQQAIKDLFNNASNTGKTIDECMTTVVRDINDALGI